MSGAALEPNRKNGRPCIARELETVRPRAESEPDDVRREPRRIAHPMHLGSPTL